MKKNKLKLLSAILGIGLSTAIVVPSVVSCSCSASVDDSNNKPQQPVNPDQNNQQKPQPPIGGNDIQKPNIYLTYTTPSSTIFDEDSNAIIKASIKVENIQDTNNIQYKWYKIVNGTSIELVQNNNINISNNNLESTLTINNIDPSWNNITVFCTPIYKNQEFNNKVNTFTLHVKPNSAVDQQKPNINLTYTTSPSTSFNEGSNATINASIKVENIQDTNNIQYKWYKIQDNQNIELTSNSNINIVNNNLQSSLTINNISSSWNNIKVFCVAIYNGQEFNNSSNTFTINVNPKPVVINVSLDQTNLTLTEGDTLTINSNVSGSNYDASQLKYQWYDVTSQTNIQGQTSSTLNISNVDMNWNNKSVQLIVSYNNQTFKSDVCHITINPKPVVINVSLDQTNLTLTEGDTLTINSNVSGSNYDASQLKYQWYDVTSQTNIQGQTSSTLNISNVDMSWNNKSVQLIVSYNNQTFKSNTCNINVKPKSSTNPLIENVDYFNVNIDGVNKQIILPSTQNQELINKYGNAPLPLPSSPNEDVQITENDIQNMFSFLAMMQNSTKITFGDRKIETNFFIKSLLDFLIEKWIYFPSMSFANRGWTWDCNIPINKNDLPSPSEMDNNKYYVTGTKQSNNANYIKEWTSIGSQDWLALQTFLKTVLSLIQPGMTDFDKLLVVYQFIINWTVYENTSEGSNGSQLPSQHIGICSDYSTIMALVLNVLDIPSFPISVRYFVNGPGHQILWVYLDPTGGNNKQWYACDPVSGIGDATGGYNVSSYNPFASWATQSNLLFSVAQNSDGKNDIAEHDFKNLYFNIPWRGWSNTTNPNSIGLSNIGEYNYASDPNGIFSLITNYVNQNNAELNYFTKLMFINNKWYTVLSVLTPSGELNKKNLIEIDSTNHQIKNITSTLPSFVQDEIFAIPATTSSLQYKNNIMFIGSDTKSTLYGNKYLYVFKTDNQNGINFNNFKKINLNTTQNISSINFIPEQQEIVIYYNGGANKTSYQLSIDEMNFINNKTYDSNDVNLAYQYFRLLVGTINTTDPSIYKQKNDIYNQLKQLKDSNNNQTDTINQMNNIVNNLIKNSINPNLMFVRLNPSIVGTDDSLFNEYGLNLNPVMINKLQDLIDVEFANSVRFNLYYKLNENDSFKLIAQNINSLMITRDFLNQYNLSSPYGYFYYEAYPYDNDNQKITSNIIRVVNDSSINPQVSDLYLNNKSILVNYFDSNLQTNNLNITTNISSSVSNWSLKFIRKSDQQIVDLGAVNSYSIDNVTDQNSGIYFIDHQINYQGQIYHEYSSFLFILTQNDYSSFNQQFGIWNNLISKIIK